MNFALSDDHALLRQSANDFLTNEIDLSPLLVPGATVEAARYGANWKKMVELGWPGLIIPEEFGGSGLTPLDLSMIVSEMGRTLAPAPFLGTLAGTWALLKAGSTSQKEMILPRVATEGFRLALAVSDASGQSDGPTSDATAAADGNTYRLNGHKSFVADAASADLLIVAATHNGKRGLYLVDPRQSSVSVKRLPWRDVTREVCSVSFDNAQGELLIADDKDVWPWIKDRLLLVLATESAAGLQHVIEITTAYAKERVAFGKPIGAYQAIKHQLADLFCLGECANVAVLYAAWTLSQEDSKGPQATAMAKSYACDAYVSATHQSIQIFGAIGFTWEMKNHLYFKRARANAEMLGSPTAQRARLVRMLETEAA